MKKVFLSVLMGLMFMPMELLADHYESDRLSPQLQIPVKSPNLVNAWIDSETGEFFICANYDITCLYVSVQQNGVVLDSFSRPLSNGIPVSYDFSGYSTGEYIVTLSTVDGVLSQYLVTVVHD